MGSNPVASTMLEVIEKLNSNDNAVDGMVHIFCCDPGTALCGTKLVTELDAEVAADCMVCADLEFSFDGCSVCNE
jgi:hypothetical protein